MKLIANLRHYKWIQTWIVSKQDKITCLSTGNVGKSSLEEYLISSTSTINDLPTLSKLFF